jgi:transposase-like protein
MARPKIKRKGVDWKALLAEERDLLKSAVQEVVQEILEAEMEQTVGAAKNERTAVRTGYRSGYYRRDLVTRVGKLELRVPQDRAGQFSTEVFERYQRSEKALVASLAEMYVQGVSTRKVKAITEELCGHSFSASTISRINKTLDGELKKFATRHLDEEYPYLILDARYEKVREDGVIRTRAVMIAIGAGRGAGGARKYDQLERVAAEPETAWPLWSGVRRHRRSRGPETSHYRGPARSDLAALLRSLFEKRLGLSAPQGG